MSLITRSALPPSNLRIVFSAAGLMPLVTIWRRLRLEIFDSYRPELHYMRGLGRDGVKSTSTFLRPCRFRVSGKLISWFGEHGTLD